MKKIWQIRSGKPQNAKIYPRPKSRQLYRGYFLCFPWRYWVGFFAVLHIIKLVLIYPQNPNTLCSLQTRKQKLSTYITTSHIFINWVAWLIAAIFIQRLPKQGFSHCIFHKQFINMTEISQDKQHNVSEDHNSNAASHSVTHMYFRNETGASVLKVVHVIMC